MYLIPESDLQDGGREGGLRLLEVDNRIIVPELTHIRFITRSADVIQLIKLNLFYKQLIDLNNLIKYLIGIILSF